MTTVHVFLEISWGIQIKQKIDNIMTLFKNAPMTQHWQIFLKFDDEGMHYSTNSGGPSILEFDFFNLAPEGCLLFGNDASITERWSRMGNFTFKWKLTKKSQFLFSSIGGNL